MTAPADRDEAPTPQDAVAGAVRGLFGRDSLYMLSWAVQLGAAAALTPAITRVLGAEEFGVLATAIAVMQVLVVVAGLGLRVAVQRHYVLPDGDAQARRLLLLTLLAAGAFTLLTDASGGLWAGWLGFDHYTAALRLAVYWSGLSAVVNASLALLRSEDRLLAFSVVSLLQSVVPTVVGLVLVLRVHPTATMFLVGQVLMQGVALLLGLWWTPLKMLRVRDLALARTALRYALPLVPAVLCTFVLGSSDRLIVQAELGLTAVARYQVAYNVGDMPILLLGVLSTSWMPRLFALGTPGHRTEVLASSRDILYRLLTPVIVGLSVGSPLVLRVWAPPEYRPDDLMLVTAVVIISAVPYTAGLSARVALLAEGRSGMIALATGVAAVVNVVLNLILVPRFELLGAAVSTLVAYAVLHVLLLARVGRVLSGGSTSPIRLLEVTAAVAVALGAAAVPTTGGYLFLRAAVVLASLAWFGWVLLATNRRPAALTAASPRHRAPASAAPARTPRRRTAAVHAADGGVHNAARPPATGTAGPR